jgi:hypothetical protein
VPGIAYSTILKKKNLSEKVVVTILLRRGSCSAYCGDHIKKNEWLKAGN